MRLLRAGFGGLAVSGRLVGRGVWSGGVRLWRLGSGRGGDSRQVGRRGSGEDICVTLWTGNIMLDGRWVMVDDDAGTGRTRDRVLGYVLLITRRL
jgi:hypothetical protein